MYLTLTLLLATAEPKKKSCREGGGEMRFFLSSVINHKKSYQFFLRSSLLIPLNSDIALLAIN